MFDWLFKKEKVVEEPKEEILEDSTLTFTIDKDLKVVMDSKINPEIVPELVKQGFINQVEAESEEILQLSFVVLANEVTEQIITNINDANS